MYQLAQYAESSMPIWRSAMRSRPSFSCTICTPWITKLNMTEMKRKAAPKLSITSKPMRRSGCGKLEKETPIEAVGSSP